MAISTDRSAAGFEKQAVHTAASRENQDTRGPPWQTDFSHMIKRNRKANALGRRLLKAKHPAPLPKSAGRVE
jgi:hypothetical protein